MFGEALAAVAWAGEVSSIDVGGAKYQAVKSYFRPHPPSLYEIISRLLLRLAKGTSQHTKTLDTKSIDRGITCNSRY